MYARALETFGDRCHAFIGEGTPSLFLQTSLIATKSIGSSVWPDTAVLILCKRFSLHFPIVEVIIWRDYILLLIIQVLSFDHQLFHHFIRHDYFCVPLKVADCLR